LRRDLGTLMCLGLAKTLPMDRHVSWKAWSSNFEAGKNRSVLRPEDEFTSVNNQMVTRGNSPDAGLWKEVLRAFFASNLSIRNRQKDDDDIDTCRNTIWALWCAWVLWRNLGTLMCLGLPVIISDISHDRFLR